jgi:hypothetical protein
MKRKAKPGRTRSGGAGPRKQNWLLTVIVVVAVLVILLRMVVFVAGHGHHR